MQTPSKGSTLNPYEDAAGSDSGTATFFSGLDVNPLRVNYSKCLLILNEKNISSRESFSDCLIGTHVY